MSDQVFQVLTRYILGAPIASGGMATVYLGRPVSLPRVVAIKKLRPEMAHDRAFVRMFLDEAQLLCRIRHKNVAPPIDCFEHAGEFFIVMEYVEGQSLSQLLASAPGPVPAGLASKIMTDVLTGIDAAHDAVDCAGQPLNLVHRDVSPHNILVGTDGAARIVDFGIAKAAWRAHVTQHGQVKGKPGYMAPEQLVLGNVDRRTDVYAAGIVLWELLAGRKLLGDQSMQSGSMTSSAPEIVAPSELVPNLSRAIDGVVLSALSRNPDHRFSDARSMAEALLDAAPPARDFEVGAWVTARAHDELRRRAELVAELENVRLSEVAARAASAQLSPAVEISPSKAGREAPPSGYAMGQHEASSTVPADVDVRRPPSLRMGYMIAVLLAVTLVALGGTYVARSRSPASVAPAPGTESTPTTADASTLAAAEGDLPAPVEAVLPSAPSSAQSQEHPAQPSLDSRRPVEPRPPPARAGQSTREGFGDASPPSAKAGASPPRDHAPDSQPRAYDPLHDDRRR